MKRLALVIGVLCAVLVGIAAPASAEQSLKLKCEEQEILVKFEVEGAPFANWSPEQKEAFIRQETAQCQKDVQEAETIAKQAEAESIHRQEREATKRREEEAERRTEKRQIERERRHRSRIAARHRREWAHKPTVTEPVARYLARRLMNETEYSVWIVDCGGGKINRTHWSCSVHIFYQCLRGRIRVSGAGFKNHQPFYNTKGSELRPCTLGDSVLH